MYKNSAEKLLSPHELAHKFEVQIKETVAEKFSLKIEELSLLLEDKEGVYLSKEESNTLCSFVVGEKNGHLYLVTAKIEYGGKKLDNFKCDIIS